ncbi:MAG: arylesterase [Thiobacillus sp.]
MNYRVCVLLLLLLAMPGWVQAGSCTVLIVGDSLSSGYGLDAGHSWVNLLEERLKKAAPPQKNQQWRVINASVSGDTTQNGLQRLQPALERHHPQGVLIQLGGNDALRGTPPAAIRQNLQAMVRQAKAAGAWVALLEAPVLPNYGKRYADAVAKLYVDVAREQKIVRVPCFICDVAVMPGMMQADGIHPNEKAQSRMLDAVWPYIQPKLRCPVYKP